MPTVIVLDSFPLSCIGKNPVSPPSTTDQCRHWILECIVAGNLVRVPAITYYETLRELKRLKAIAQIERLRTFAFSDPDRFIPLETAHLEEAAELWARARHGGQPTADPQALDGDVILAAQALGLQLPPTDYVVATTNPSHLSQFVTCALWNEIAP